jgi:cytochrome P450
MVQTVAAMLQRWDAQGSHVFDMAKETMRLAYEVISKTVFSDEIETSAEVMGAAITRYFDLLGRIDLWDVLPLPHWLPRPSLIRVRPAIRVFRHEVRRLLDRRRAAITAGKAVPEDLVTLLTRARDPETGSLLAEDVIHDNLVTFIGAGFAMQEALIALPMIVQQFQPLPVSNAEIEPVSRMTLRPKGGLPLELRRPH